jgi:hypothetical protein
MENVSHHLSFSSSVSVKKRISKFLSKRRRKDRSTQKRPSYSSKLLVDVCAEEGVRSRSRGSGMSSTAIAFRRSMVAVALLVTSLKATKLAPMTRNCLLRHVYVSQLVRAGEMVASTSRTEQSPPFCVKVPSKYVILCQWTWRKPRWHSSRLWGS